MQTLQLIKMLQSHGRDVAVLANDLPSIGQYQGKAVPFTADAIYEKYISQGVKISDTRSHVNGYTIYLKCHMEGGWDMLRDTILDFKADAVIVLLDMWTLPFELCHSLPKIKYYIWEPIDTDPISKSSVISLRALEKCQDMNLSGMSMHGCNELVRYFKSVTYIPHCVDTSVFNPGKKIDARRRLRGFPVSGFITSMVAQNKGIPSRKAFDQNLKAWKRFYDTLSESEKPDVWLYLHTNYTDPAGVDINGMIELLGIPRSQIIPYDSNRHCCYSLQEMADIYRSTDVLMAASCGEGFGIPIIEAQACGTVVITSKFTSMPELTFFGECVEPVGTQFMYLSSWWCIPDYKGIANALLREYHMWKGRHIKTPEQNHRQLDRLSVANKIALDFGVPTVMRRWEAFLGFVDAETSVVETK